MVVGRRGDESRRAAARRRAAEGGGPPSASARHQGTAPRSGPRCVGLLAVRWLSAAALASVGGVAASPPTGVETARLYGNLNKYAYYFTDLLIGAPNPQETSVIVDTGSRLVGFPCTGCDHCGNHIDPAFNMEKSESARWLSCDDSCAGECVGGQCTYHETYSEGSSISGRWFDDVVQLGGAYVTNPKVRARMGCHEHENKLFFTQRANGIMGLAPWGAQGSGGGPATILQDFFKDTSHVNSKMFSLCLATWGGQLTVGGIDDSYHRKGSQVQWTPMLASHYYFVYPEQLRFEGAGVSPAEVNSQIALSNSEFGVTIIDSGTTFAYFPSVIYRSLVAALDAKCGHGECGGAVREGECFRLRDPLSGPIGFPTLVLHFRGGVRNEWLPHGYLHERGEQGVWCQTFMENNLYQTVLGISWMLHQDIIFDIDGQRMGIVAADCPEHHKTGDIMQKSEVVSARLGEALLRSAREHEAPPVLVTPSSLLGRHVAAGLLVAFGAVGAMALIAGWSFSLMRLRPGRCLARGPGGGDDLGHESQLLAVDAEGGFAQEARARRELVDAGASVQPL